MHVLQLKPLGCNCASLWVRDVLMTLQLCSVVFTGPELLELVLCTMRP